MSNRGMPGIEMGHSAEPATAGMGGPGEPFGFTAVPYSGERFHRGYPDPSDTYRWGDQGTEWPMDTFTQMVVQAQEHPISRPMPHSYYGDDNMEAYVIAGPYVADSEAATDLGLFTGATGPSGHVTPPAHPELTAPQSPSSLSDQM